MASFDLPEIPQPRVSPALLVGVASPLWSYFGAAAAGGLAYWWMTQWARPVNLEALMGAAKALPTPEPLFEPAVEVVEALVEATEQVLEDAGDALLEAAPLAVGGEAAPISPLMESAAAPAIDPGPELIADPAPFEPAAEPVLEAAPEPVIEEPAPVGSEPALKPRGKKAPSTEA
ncbi:MAG: hypothetical protein A2790_14820 [Phenylobacterium sp. RIFCSPHIGHO2_01_FULL_69_31]|uniref:hypothetical protein n=1 Tax=Phenylobacterium sp. RIFCSPHIGHO2_01_FULL_69_31 TaxID=1801944 RepID=UPI0008CE4C63|nr:hypothetical protein [Phenylobacterium sp. RIFCSPHIGHO2_01_FULL_69_31]OHB27910.1 MAG: hypothetical protein A2790_14820 [Phenylobacterium sp. RIFCSPHIGHO2_01_FULL_69_31]